MKFPKMHQLLKQSCKVLCLAFLFFTYLLNNACITAKKAVYFYDLQADTLNPGVIVHSGTTQFVDPKIQKNDILSVTIQTLAQNAGNAPVASNSSTSSNLFGGFLVDKGGLIELSLIGFVKVEGLTTAEARDLIKEKAKEFYKEPVITVRIANFDVMVTGDVGKPGPVNIASEKASIIDVIALAGDLAGTAKRKNILLVRTEGDQTKFVRLDITSSDIFKSPYFYVKQRDYIYVEPNAYKRQSGDNSFTRYLGYGSGIIGVISLLFLLRVIK